MDLYESHIDEWWGWKYIFVSEASFDLRVLLLPASVCVSQC